jgi:hypothetical protein
MAGGLAGGFVSGFAGSLLNGGSLGDAFKAGVIGGAIGMVTGGLLGKIGDMAKAGDLGWFGKSVAHGAVLGAAEEAQGGQFRHGFYAGFVTASFSGRIDGIGKGEAWGRAARVTAAAVVGGTASAVGGGKFANGAISAAFSRMFNDHGPGHEEDDEWSEVEKQEQRLRAFADDGVHKRLTEAVTGLGKGVTIKGTAGPVSASTAPLADKSNVRVEIRGGEKFKVIVDSTGKVVAERSMGPVTLSVDNTPSASASAGPVTVGIGGKGASVSTSDPLSGSTTLIKVGTPAVNVKVQFDASKGTIPAIPGTLREQITK